MRRTVTVLYFAWLRERIGCGAETLALPDAIDRVDELISWLAARGPGHAAAFARPEAIRCALDQVFAGHEAKLGAAREVAFFPPVTGG